MSKINWSDSQIVEIHIVRSGVKQIFHQNTAAFPFLKKRKEKKHHSWDLRVFFLGGGRVYMAQIHCLTY